MGDEKEMCVMCVCLILMWGGVSVRIDDVMDDDVGLGRSTKSLGTTRRLSEGWII